eukprot:CAMPEP_0167806852 /NCGR_PEP_ID=MMETSP0111_2-20121227/22117_1 /TAXON_ID=91324 /ORGANISM="Lotharella globosa, Strain CCCM811" /LENGTH=60 /DNA_ID=CAMNT_0007704469 /DNA_START=184 /DNA_END=366 /DNA_ORIENTATION=-
MAVYMLRVQCGPILVASVALLALISVGISLRLLTTKMALTKSPAMIDGTTAGVMCARPLV